MLSWHEEYKTGIEHIDSQHKELFCLVQNFLDATTHKTLVLHAMRLFQYTRQHFKDEEDILRDIGFPDLHEHTENHNKILARLSELAREVATNRFSKEKTVLFFDHWLNEHIGQDDQQIRVAYACKNP